METTPQESPSRSISPLAWVLIAGGVLRVAMLVDFVRSNPTADFVQGDAGVYWTEAGRIAAGRIVGDAPFFSIPLYTFFLAGIRAIGGSLMLAYVAQIALHLGTAAILAVTVRRRLGDVAGLLACGLFLLALEPAFYVTRLLPGTLQLFLVALLVWSAQHWSTRPTRPATAMLGAVTGLLALAYPPAMLLVPVVVIWVFMRLWRMPLTVDQRGIDGAWESAVLAGMAACLTIAPATLHNWYAADEFIPITSHAGITFRQGNAPGADGLYTPVAGVSAVRERMHADAARVFARDHGRLGSYGEIDAYFRRQAWDWLLDDPMRAAGLMARKVYWFATGRHYSDIYYPTLEQADGWIHLLWLAPVHTAWLMGPALVGVWLMRRARTLHVMEAVLAVLPLVIVAGFWYSPRYRLPALIPLIIFTTGALHGAIERWRARRNLQQSPTVVRLGHVIALAAAAGLSMVTGPINAATGFDARAAYRPQYAFNLGQLFLGRGEPEAALVQFEKSDELRPGEGAVLAAIVEAHARLNHQEEALLAARNLIQTAPDAVASWLTLGGAYLRFGDSPKAAAAFREALDRDAFSAEAHLGLYLATSKEHPDEAIEHLRRALALNPADPMARCEFALWLARGDDQTRAESGLRECVALAPDRPDAHFALGEILLRRNRRDDAAVHLSEAVRLNPQLEDRLRGLLADVGRAAGSAQIAEMRERIRANPKEARLYSELAGALYSLGELANAVDALREGVRAAEDKVTISLELAWILSTTPDGAVRNGPEALRLVEPLCGGEAVVDALPECMDVLAAALAETGDFHHAAITATNAAAIAEAGGRRELAEVIRGRAALYDARTPYRQPM